MSMIARPSSASSIRPLISWEAAYELLMDCANNSSRACLAAMSLYQHIYKSSQLKYILSIPTTTKPTMPMIGMMHNTICKYAGNHYPNGRPTIISRFLDLLQMLEILVIRFLYFLFLVLHLLPKLICFRLK